MSAKTAKKIRCNRCGHVMVLNSWGKPIKHQGDGYIDVDYMDVIERSRERLKKETGFGIKEEDETNKERSRSSKEKSSKSRKEKRQS